MPKLEYTRELDLKPVLSAMGMPNAFIAADFSGLNATESLKIDFVKHKAFVLVDEEGTEAAAATGAGVTVVSLPRDLKTNAVLFIGRVQELGAPAQAN